MKTLFEFFKIGLLLFLLFHLAGCTSIESHMIKGNYGTAQRKIESKIAQNPGDDYHHYLLAIIHREQGDYQLAAKFFQRAININPHKAEYYFEYAYMLTRYQSPPTPHYQQAADLLQESINIDPQYYPALEELILVQYALQEYTKVIETADKLLAVSYCEPMGLTYHGLALEAMQRWESAITYYEWVLDECGDEAYRFRLAWMFEKNDADFHAMMEWKNYREKMGALLDDPDSTLCFAERRLYDLQLQYKQDLIERASHPINLLRTPSICTNQHQNQVDLYFTILNKYDIADFTIYHNKQEVDIPNKKQLIKQINDQDHDLFLSQFPLKSGKNTITLIVKDVLRRKTKDTFYFWIE